MPLHGHLAPAAWAAAQAGRGSGSATSRPAAGRCPGSLSRDVAELRERGLLCGHITAAPAYGGEHEALSTVGALDAAATALGWDAILVGPGPGIIGSDTEFGHGGMAALDSAHAALSLRLPTIVSPRLSSADPRERHRGLSHHTATVLELLLAPVTVAVPEVGDAGAAELASQIEAASGGRHHLEIRLRRPRRLRRLRAADDHDGAGDRRGPAVLRSPARRRARLARRSLSEWSLAGRGFA